ncbi:hypothetical protein E2562_008044 [Oryza meyeriana var. granulata]|uniref:JAB1/MPN/MOV34 metalloenzyme domain-containing protein n=1 Tax=Oryza meyeriana var. granulata TaxID=110450 RepID=A0A6G1DFV6_9ORYZ|nr:hypothetical protein E2562_008044 [Oryza meyeriana var. granulata]
MCGCVTGVQHRRTVEVFDSFDLRLDPDSGILDCNLLEKEQDLCKKAFPNLAILGWYSIGTNVQDTDMQIHQTVVRTLGFIQVDNKSVAWDSDVGPGKDLEQFILKFPITKALIVSDAQLKFVIEKKLITKEFINMVGYLNYLEYASKCFSMGLHQRFDRFFRWRDMSDLEFAKAIADSLHSLEEVASKPGKLNKQEILSSIEFILAAPGKKNHTMPLLKHMEVEARAVGPVKSWVWVAVFGLGYAITVGMLARIQEYARRNEEMKPSGNV